MTHTACFDVNVSSVNVCQKILTGKAAASVHPAQLPCQLICLVLCPLLALLLSGFLQINMQLKCLEQSTFLRASMYKTVNRK
jgi:hypothetical protein